LHTNPVIRTLDYTYIGSPEDFEEALQIDAITDIAPVSGQVTCR